jgi:hypothetical protein
MRYQSSNQKSICSYDRIFRHSLHNTFRFMICFITLLSLLKKFIVVIPD